MAFWKLVVEDDDGNRTTHIRRENTLDSAKDWGETCFGVRSVVHCSPADDEVKHQARHLRDLIEECWGEGSVKDLFLNELNTGYDL